MGSPSETVEAHTFDRRRFTTALVSGSPGLARPDQRGAVRSVVGGVALALLLSAGAVVARMLSPGPPEDWTHSGLIVSEDTGQAFVIVPEHADEGAGVELRPVANLTSARLVLGSDVEPVVVSQEAIEGQRVGPEIGIPDAPTSPPSPARLVQTGWTACTDSSGVGLRLRADRVDPVDLAVPGAGQVVVVGGESYLLVNVPIGAERQAAYALPLPDDDGVDNLLSALGLPARVLAPRVPRAWLDLIPRGAPLTWRSFGLLDLGRRPAHWDAAGVPARARTGDVVVDPTGAAVVLTERGPADLDPFAAAVYTHVRTPGGGRPAVIAARRLPDLARVALPAHDLDWPTRPPEPIHADPCAGLATAGDGPATVALVRDAGLATGGGVDPGHGALVSDVRPGRAPAPVLVDSSGRAHALEGDALTRLGYADVVLPTVPHAWVRLLDPGVPLSRELALCSPAEECDGSGAR